MTMVAGAGCGRPVERAAASRAVLRCAWAALLMACAAARADDPAGSITGKPLSPNPHPRGKTMFVELSPADTGLVTENRYEDPSEVLLAFGGARGDRLLGLCKALRVGRGECQVFELPFARAYPLKSAYPSAVLQFPSAPTA